VFVAVVPVLLIGALLLVVLGPRIQAWAKKRSADEAAPISTGRMALLVLGTFTGAYPLMYFAQEFISLNVAMIAASVLVLVIIAIRSMTIMSAQLAIAGVVLPAATLLGVTLEAAIHPRLQGLLITGVGMALFIVAMVLIPRLQRGTMGMKAQAAAV